MERVRWGHRGFGPCSKGPWLTTQPLSLRRGCWEAPAPGPCSSSLCFVICWFDHGPGRFPSAALLPVRGQAGAGGPLCWRGRRPVLLIGGELPSDRPRLGDPSQPGPGLLPHAWHRNTVLAVLWGAGLCVCPLKLPLACILGQHSDTPAPWHARTHTHTYTSHTQSHTHTQSC